MIGFCLWHMPHGITHHIAPKDSNSYHLPWNHSTDLPASTSAGPSCKHCSSQHHHVPSNGPSFTWLLALLLLCWCSSHNLHLITKPLLDKVSSNQQASTSSCLKTALTISRKTFITETSFLAAIALAKFSTPPRALHRHTRVPCKLSVESQADYRTLLALLLIANCDTFLTTSVVLTSLFSTRLLQWRLQYFLLHNKPPWNSGNNFYCRNHLLAKNSTNHAVHLQVHFNSTQECHTCSQKNLELTTASSSASSNRRWWCTSLDFCPIARSTLINLLGITNLLCL